VWKWVVVVAALARPVEAGEAKAGPAVNVVAPARFPDDLPGPPAEHARDTYEVKLPEVPGFALPAPEAGVHAPGELRMGGKVDGVIRVRGYVTWVYDCAAELARGNPQASRAQIAEAIEREPALCEAPMFALGDGPTSRDYVSIEVADVPRGVRLAVGDRVVVTGTWATESPGGERNPDGLLVYRAVEALPAAKPALVAAASGLPDLDVERDVPLRPVIDTAIRNASVGHLNACTRAITAKQYDAAECAAATAAWPDNHLAWYHLASARLAQQQWREMAAAIDRAVALRPDLAMYQLYAGLARYYLRRDDPAARDALLRAVKLDPALWRARYFLGRSFLASREPRRAAEQLGEAIRLHPSYTPAYVPLVELYLRWGYVDAAIAVATLGTSAAADPGALWRLLAEAHRARHDDAAALPALDQAIAAHPDDADALLQRAELHLRRQDPTRARADLARVAATGDAADKQRAQRLLAQLASRGDRPAYKQVSRPSEGTYHPWTLEDQKYRF
jgi:tetratricopeptide (TPR) repeat protein